MKTMCPPGYHHNGFVATHALGHMMYIYIYIYSHTYLRELRSCSFYGEGIFLTLCTCKPKNSKSYAMFYYTSVSLLHCFHPKILLYLNFSSVIETPKEQ